MLANKTHAYKFFKEGFGKRNLKVETFNVYYNQKSDLEKQNYRKIKPKKFWNDTENVKNFLLLLKEKLKLNSAETWNLVSQKNIREYGGGSLLKKYSLNELKLMGCPEGKLIFESKNRPAGYWNDKENVKKFLDDLKEKLNLNTPEDWNLITKKQIQLNGGNGIIEKYSIFDIKCIGYPEGKLIFNPSYKPAGYWNDKENVKKFLDDLKEKLNLNTPEDWNLITKHKIQKNGGGALFQKYSILELKLIGCPEGKSIFNEPFRSKPSGYWDNDENIKALCQNLQIKLHLKSLDDWKRVSKKQIIAHGGSDKLSISKIMQFHVNQTIENHSFTGNNKSAQRWLLVQIQKLFPGEEIVEDYFHSDISRDSGFPVQFDIFLIDRKIAIEYHGKHHYEDMPFAFSPIEMYKNRDNEKEKLCLKYGIKLIVIPYWWDNNLDSLNATITSHCNKEAT